MPRKSEFAAAATLVGKDQLSKPWKKALKSAERQAGRSFSKIERFGLRSARILNKGFKAAGAGARGIGKASRFAGRSMKTMTIAAGGVVAAGAAAIDQFGKYELAVARLGNVLGTKGKDVVDEYGGALKGLALELGVGPLEVAEAAYQALSGGVERNKDKLLEFLRAAGQASVAGGTDMATAVKAATGVMEVFGDEVGTVNDVFNKLFVTEREGVTTFGDLASNLGDVTAFARSMGLSFEEILGPVASLTKTGLSTSASLTQLEAIIGGVTNATGKQKKAFRDLKIPFGPDAVAKAGGFVKLLEQIGAASRKDKGAFQRLFGRKEAIKGTARLTQSGLESLQTTMAGFKGESTVFQDNFANMQKRTGFRIRQLKAGFSSMIGELGGGLAEGLGIAETSTDKIGSSFITAGKSVRSGAKAFAEGFVGALKPGQSLADIDWKEIAKDAGAGLANIGVALGKLATGFVKFTKIVGDGISALSDFADAAMKGDVVTNPADRAQARTEAKATLAKDDTSLLQRAGLSVFGSGSHRAQGRTKDLQRRINSGELKLRHIEVSPEEMQTLMLRAQMKREAAARKKHGKTGSIANKIRQAGAGGESGNVTNILKKMAPGAAMAVRQATEVGGKVEVTITDKTAAKSVDVKATSKNPKVPVSAKVGKRKVAGG